ncbi:hypothetical protein WH303_18125 [Comamonas sp. MYb69]
MTKEQIELGYQRFLKHHPHAKTQVKERSEKMADILGIKISDLQHIETANILIEYANFLGIDSFEYLLQFAIGNKEHRKTIIGWRNELLSNAIGSKK